MDYIEAWETMGVNMEQPQKDKPRCTACKRDIPADCLNCFEMEAALYHKRRFHISMAKDEALCGMREPMLACYPGTPATCCQCWAIVRSMSQHKGGLIILKRILKEHGVEADDFSKVVQFVANLRNDPSERK